MYDMKELAINIVGQIIIEIDPDEGEIFDIYSEYIYIKALKCKDIAPNTEGDASYFGDTGALISEILMQLIVALLLDMSKSTISYTKDNLIEWFNKRKEKLESRERMLNQGKTELTKKMDEYFNKMDDIKKE